MNFSDVYFFILLNIYIYQGWGRLQRHDYNVHYDYQE